jgi:gliding motility-associated-like protein
MKSLKLICTFSALGLLTQTSNLFGQLVPNGGYLIGDHVEVGINNNGHEGTFTLGGSHARSSGTFAPVFFGFVANPQQDGWLQYDGDFFTPGTPENGFGIEINGVNYSNNGATPSFGILQNEIPGSLSNYEQNGSCNSVQWEGSVNNVGVKLVYSLNVTELYYTTEVTITNNTGATLNDVYFYRNVDPDNNQFLNGDYSTTNSIVAQPAAGCEKALVSATQSTPWDSYIGLAAIGPNFRVSYGGFANRDGSDIWNGTFPLVGSSGFSTFADEAISLAYKITTLPAGASETFQFSVILDQNQIDAAIASLYYFDFVGGSGLPVSYCEPVIDTVFTCAGIPTTISVEGPNSADYTWAWTPTTDLSVTTGTTTEASPNTTTTYTATGTPTGTCISGDIVKQIVVDLTAGPEIEIVDPGPQCGAFDLTTLVVNDLNNTPGTITEFFSVIPDSADQVAGQWPTNTINPGDVVYVMIGDPVGGCYAFEQVIINFGSGAAGADSTYAQCANNATLDLDNFLSVGTTGGVWSETTAIPSGQFTPGTGAFNTTGEVGTFTFQYVIDGVGACPDDISTITITIHPIPNADFEYLIAGQSSANGLNSGCISNPLTMDNNSTISSGTITNNSWSFGNGSVSTLGNPNYQYPVIGNYVIQLTVTSNFGCTDSHTMPVEITTSPTILVNANDPTCYQFSDGSITINTSLPGSYTYLILDDDIDSTQMNIGNSNAANNLVSGWYYLIVDDGLGCDGIDSVFIDQPDELGIDLVLTQPLCYGSNTGIAFVDTVFNYTGSYNAISYFWNPTPTGQIGLGQDSATNMGAGDYTLTLNDQSGCSNVFDFTITFPDSLYFVQLGSEPAFCRVFGYQSGNGVVFAAAAGGTPDYSYIWTNLETGVQVTNTTWGGLNPATYQIEATDDNGCVITEIVELDSLNPLADFEMTSPQFTSDYYGVAPVDVHFVNQSLYFANPNDPNADTTFFWNLNSPTSAWILSVDVFETFDSTYLDGGEYQVCLVAINKNGCTDTLCKPLIIYNALAFTPVNIFTPDGDGNNDEFSFIEYAKGVDEFYCLIVNRWGVKVHEMNDITASWDGTDMSGSQCNDGVYFYTYRIVAEDGEIVEGQGTVQIVHSK